MKFPFTSTALICAEILFRMVNSESVCKELQEAQYNNRTNTKTIKTVINTYLDGLIRTKGTRTIMTTIQQKHTRGMLVVGEYCSLK